MTKKDLSAIVGLSRPTIDKKIKEDSNFRDMLYFIISFSLFEYKDRVDRVKKYMAGKNGKTTEV